MISDPIIAMFKNVVEVPKVARIFIEDQEHDWEHTFHMYENIECCGLY